MSQFFEENTRDFITLPPETFSSGCSRKISDQLIFTQPRLVKSKTLNMEKEEDKVTSEWNYLNHEKTRKNTSTINKIKTISSKTLKGSFFELLSSKADEFLESRTLKRKLEGQQNKWCYDISDVSELDLNNEEKSDNFEKYTNNKENKINFFDDVLTKKTKRYEI